jgi:hypothetical protein
MDLTGGGGTGLGLSLSKDFIHSGHQGEIGVRSPGDLGCGSTFFFIIDFPLITEEMTNTTSWVKTMQSRNSRGRSYLSFPQLLKHVSMNADDTDDEIFSPRILPSSSNVRHSLSTTLEALQRTMTPIAAHVLIVDDSAITRKLVGRTLQSLGATFDACQNGQEAVEKLESGARFLLILMDKEMVSKVLVIFLLSCFYVEKICSL